MIVSFVDGRMRVRDESLKNTFIAKMIKEGLTSLGGVIEVITNQRVGSILIIYEPTRVAINDIISVINRYIAIPDKADRFRTSGNDSLEIFLKQKSLKLSVRKIANTGMLASLLLMLFASVLDFTGVHIIAGLIFLLFLSLHLFIYRKMIFA